MKYDNILIVTYGRSGSTLLQGILNSAEEVMVYGENHDFLRPLYNAYLKLTETKKMATPDKTAFASHSWHGSEQLSSEEYILWVRSLLARMYPAKENETIGFKEIRYHISGKGFEGYLNFIKKVWPNTFYVFLSRDAEEVSKSAWWANKPKEEVFELIKQFEEKTKVFSEDLKEACYHINFADVVKNNEKLEGLFKAIGATYNKEQIAKSLEKPHSSGNSKKAPQVKYEKDPEPNFDVNDLNKLFNQESPLRFNKEFEEMRNALKRASTKMDFLEKKVEGYKTQFDHQPDWYKKVGKVFWGLKKIKSK